MKYPPRPWEAEHRPATPGKHGPAPDEHWAVLAPMLGRHGVVADTLNCDCTLAPEEQRDIALLIAAAPELLAALKAVMGGQLTGNVDLDAERFQAARAAIAKAEGK